ncbi:S8 family serine peptidase [Angustibacter sp. McL0619]|uniref:S8 family peptidase n=1 Tax=Angustibacter sp. McL0619 TaxID=3415676 RepID=UPI003CEA244B
MRHAAIAVLVTGLAVLGVAPTAGAAPNGTDRFTKAPSHATKLKTPIGLSDAQITVVVQLAAPPVALAQAAASSQLSRSQQSDRRAQLKADQRPVVDRARALGGTVLGQYQSAYNGVKVQISRSKVGALSALPGVVGVHEVQLMKPDNVHGVPLIGAPAVWDGVAGKHGEGIKVAIIDTGIDYTHADFGGPGTVAAYTAAHAAETSAADPALFGPGAPKVKGGIDLAGDAYTGNNTPQPDPNPLDCNGHGSHVAGTAAGFGVLGDGSTYTGSYDANTVSGNSWIVGPGVAPKADLYAVRVFGCTGSTGLTIDAIDWAVANGMDVINMSLGSPFGGSDDPSAVAADNATKAGVIVVTSAGNSGPNPYIVGSPSTGTGVISVAADDPTQSIPGASLALSTGGSPLTSIVANGAAIAPGTTLPIVVLRNPDSSVSLGCNPQEYLNANVTGKLVVVARGTCARVARAVFGQQAGAAAVLMINNAASLPPYDGPITGNPDTGEKYIVTIPFLGVSSTDGPAVVAADGGTVTLTLSDIANPGFESIASFSSGGPRSGDSWLKPDVTAPGVGIFSVGVGTGNGFAVLSGTSMASPHTAGMAALVKQAHPAWGQVPYWKAAIVNTADAGKVVGYSTRLAGSGLIQAPAATKTQVVATGNPGTATLNFGYAELSSDLSRTRYVTLRNFSASKVTFTVGSAHDAGSPHTLTPARTTVTVGANRTAQVGIKLNVPATTAGTSSAFNDVAGLVTFTPTGGGNSGIALNVPYYLVPQAASKIATQLNVKQLGNTGSTTATISNIGAPVAGVADWYAWGLSDTQDPGLGSNDLRAVGVQSFPADGVLAFAVNTFTRWSNASEDEFDVFVDVNNDGVDDFDVIAADFGTLTTGTANGQTAVAVFNLNNGFGSINFLADAPFNSTSMVLPVLNSQLCGTAACLDENVPIKYHAIGYSVTDGSADAVPGFGTFNPAHPAVNTGMFDSVAPNATASEIVTLDKAAFATAPFLGLMVVSHDNRGGSEARLFHVTVH